jgi:predicted dinucleotide-binding enzyme
MSRYIPIVDVPLAGDVVAIDGVPTDQFHKLLESLQDALNGRIYTVLTVPDATTNESRTIYVSDETGGATMVFSDGVNWRRVQDRAIIS